MITKCTDCIHYNGTIENKPIDYHICTKSRCKDIEYWKWVADKPMKCKDFKSKEDSWDSVSK